MGVERWIEEPGSILDPPTVLNAIAEGAKFYFTLPIK
jgi:hypothetical protein